MLGFAIKSSTGQVIPALSLFSGHALTVKVGVGKAA